MAKKTDSKSKPAAPAKRAAKPAAKNKPVVAAVPATSKAKPVAKAVQPRIPIAPAPPACKREDVALRAYFIAEKRRAHGLPGDEHHDWLEAERQLAAEKKSKKKAAKA